MSTTITNRLFRISIALAGVASLLSGAYVFAVANDDISNRATLQYSVGSAIQPETESSQAGNSIPGAGNDPQGFIFSALNNGNGTVNPHGGVVDDFDIVRQVFVKTANAGNGRLDVAGTYNNGAITTAHLSSVLGITIQLLSGQALTVEFDVTVP